MPRRMRKPNYTHEETMILLEHLDEHKHVIFGKGSNQQRADVWAAITVAVNSLPNSAGRTKKELKHRWKDLTHRMRLLEKRMKDSEDEKCSLSVSPYYNLVMKILGEKNESYNNTALLSDVQNSSTIVGLEDGAHDLAVSSDQDIKPDKNLLYALVSNSSAASSNGCPFTMETNTNSQTSELDYVNTKNITEPCKSSCSSTQNISASKSRKPYRPQCAVSSNRKSVSNSKVNLTEQKPTVGTPSAHFGHVVTKQSRPTMRLDPYTQEVLAIDELETDSDTEDDVYFQPSVPETKQKSKSSMVENGDVSITATSSAGCKSQRKRKLSCDESYLQSLSLEELKEVYLIKKIQMVSQRTKCLKLLEDKLEFQLRYLHHPHYEN